MEGSFNSIKAKSLFPSVRNTSAEGDNLGERNGGVAQRKTMNERKYFKEK